MWSPLEMSPGFIFLYFVCEEYWSAVLISSRLFVCVWYQGNAASIECILVDFLEEFG